MRRHLLTSTTALALLIGPGTAYADMDAARQFLDEEHEAGIVVAQPDAAPLSASCVEAMDKSDILWIQDNIFNSCAAFSACHGAVTPAGGLNLESGFAEAAMLNVDSVLFPEYKLVVPGDPENSYLMTILGAVDGPLSDDVGTMPYNNPTLCQPKLDAIGRWISALPQ